MAPAFAKSLGDILRDDLHARALGSSGRRMVERELTWDRYVDRLASIVQIAAGA